MTGVAELWIFSTFVAAVPANAFGLCLGAMDVSVGPSESVILVLI